MKKKIHRKDVNQLISHFFLPLLTQISKLEAATAEVDTELVDKLNKEITKITGQYEETNKDKQELTGELFIV